ncbi:MAG: hypothetical protein PHE59_01535 [Patescibacteria group bacterium]|nr:hypothetical protein [Patescibacteria group bacterium]MDD5164024.1 hypothetical protein [Patescibacteria group bacterium]MDD5534892.1 hypothetical protein [Patescibacteria group bacterium]
MRIKIDLDDSINPVVFIRRTGYAEIKDFRSGQTSYIRRLRGYHYPRFHIYIENGYFNLHLDQKAPSYEGTSAHSGEYEGRVVEEEAERIKKFFNKK